MKDKIEEFLVFLNQSINELEKMNKFIKTIPQLIESDKINLIEYQNKIEGFELIIYKIMSQKLVFIKDISNSLNIKPNELNMKLLYNMGFTKITTLYNKLQNLTNSLPYSILKATVYLKNYMNLNRKFQNINSILNNTSYTFKGEELKTQKVSSFSREA